MKVYRARRPHACPPCALTIGNFDGVHRGHQAMLALLRGEARQRGLPACVMTFEPNPRDFFAHRMGQPERAPSRVGSLRDKLLELQRCGIDEVVVTRFDERLAALSPTEFIDRMLLQDLRAKYLLVGDDFRFGAKRAGDYALLDAHGGARGLDVARMMSYEVHGLRVSSSAVRQALADGDMTKAAALLGRPYRISGHVVRGRQLGRQLGASAPGRDDGFRTLNLRIAHAKPAAMGIFVVEVHGLTPNPLPGVASLGVRPTVEDAGRVLLEVHCLEWPLATHAGYGRAVGVDLLHKLHDELRYESLQALELGIARDVSDARAWLQSRSSR
ncbi:MAG: bifunctional riboflavin kinase/FAD synthetase [Betaproteobacteria bacterium]|nr:bifunctional riboflavin kinase/FAD synthetase [Betaproteobacteria bacterium]NBU48560.1 bifunctional riboflavin kinase/FAD synthetase [Betaproteobacteria bacterium]